MRGNTSRRNQGRRLAVAALLVLGALILFDVGRRYLTTVRDEEVRSVAGDWRPPFRVGDPAPDFELPDASGRRHSLQSELHGDTLLCMLCGCDRCRQMQTYLGVMLRSLGSRAPSVVSVTTAPADAEAAWKRDTKLPQVMLYDSKEAGKPVIQQYRADPCPRVYRVAPDRRVTWIGPSPAEVGTMDQFGAALARNLGYTLPSGTPVAGNAPKPRD